MLRPWFEAYPKRLEDELQALESFGIKWSPDEAAKQQGVIVLELSVPADVTGDGDLDLVAIYPDSFPYYRPEVFARSLELPRHQQPFAKNLCLLGRSTIQWDVDSTLAELLAEQLPEALRAGAVTDPHLLASDPAEQAEPFSDYYTYWPSSCILVDSRMQVPPDHRAGRLVLGLERNCTLNVRGSLLEIQGPNRLSITRTSGTMRTRFPKRHGFRWIRLDHPLPYGRPSPELEAWLQSEHPDVLVERSHWKPVQGGLVHIVGFLFPEERAPGHLEDGWLFLVLTCPTGARDAHWYYARTGFYDRRYLFTRIPELGFMPDMTVSLVGLGCLGASIALELARAGVGTLRMMDGGCVDPGSTVRWPLGLTAVGCYKTQTIADHIATEFPLTKPEPINWKLGQIRDQAVDGARPEWELVSQLVASTNLVIDATAEFGVHHHLSDVAREQGVPYLTVSGVEGGWGGEIYRLVPGRTEGCWVCLQYWMRDKAVPEPAAPPEGSGTVQPAGCANPTYTGAGFDLGQIALAAVQLAVSTLSMGRTGQYPDPDWDYVIMSRRDVNGALTVPTWKTGQISTHPDCPICNAG